MPVSEAYVLHSVKLPSATITQLESADPQGNPTLITQYSAGDVLPMFRSVQNQEARIDFTSPQLATILGACGLLGLDLSGGNTDLHYKLVADFGTRTEGTGVRFRLAQGMMFWSTVTLPHQGVGTVNCTIQPTYDGTNPPIVPAGAAAVGTKQAAEAFGAGPVIVNTVALDGVKTITINSGFKAILESSESEVWPTLIAVEMVDPVAEVMSLTLGAWETYELAGTALTGFDAYGVKKIQHGHNSTSNNNLKFSATSGMILPISARAGGNTRALAGLRIPLTAPSAGTNPLTIATNATLP